MKKIFITFVLIITFLIVYFIQANILSNFTIAGITPNLFIILILFIGLYANQTFSIAFGIGMGLFLDLTYGENIGLTALMLCVIGWIGSYFDKNFSKDNKLTILLMVIGVTVIYEFGLYSLKAITLEFKFELLFFLRILGLEIVYNSLITIIVYPLIQKAGYSMDRTFKENNLLTRYF